jgi:hypothetical protein
MSLNETKEHKIVNELYVDACEALLSAYGLTVHVQANAQTNLPAQRPGASVLNQACYVSVLSASGDGISLSSMLRIDQNVVMNLHPLAPAQISQLDLEDWCLELNNQLIGRVKNKLLGFDCVLVVGLPVLLTGTNVTSVAAQNSQVHQYSVVSANGQIVLTLATLIAPNVDLRQSETGNGQDAVLLEGAISLF